MLYCWPSEVYCWQLPEQLLSSCSRSWSDNESVILSPSKNSWESIDSLRSSSLPWFSAFSNWTDSLGSLIRFSCCCCCSLRCCCWGCDWFVLDVSLLFVLKFSRQFGSVQCNSLRLSCSKQAFNWSSVVAVALANCRCYIQVKQQKLINSWVGREGIGVDVTFDLPPLKHIRMWGVVCLVCFLLVWLDFDLWTL